MQYYSVFLILSPPANTLSYDVMVHAVHFWGQENISFCPQTNGRCCIFNLSLLSLCTCPPYKLVSVLLFHTCFIHILQRTCTRTMNTFEILTFCWDFNATQHQNNLDQKFYILASKIQPIVQISYATRNLNHLKIGHVSTF